MCGIVVSAGPERSTDRRLDAALEDLKHRGPDARGRAWRDDHRLYLGHARLKIIDVSDAANQPFVSPCGRWAVIFNGEIYNFRDLRTEIGDRWDWRTHSDTEVLLAAWALWGSGALEKLAGMFAFAVHDAEAHTVTLVRDRFGIKPLYMTRQNARWVFASEIPPLLRFLPSTRPDNGIVRTYLETGLYDHSERTFFDGISKLEPGTLGTIDISTGELSVRRWYDLAENIPDLSAASSEELAIEADRLLSQAVVSHLVSDVAVGINVSGGVDSSLLVDRAAPHLRELHLFTQDFEGYSELPWIRQLGDVGTLHVATLDATRIAAYLQTTVASQAEPFGGVAVCGYNALYEMANEQGVTVLLDGNGLDEVFLGYRKYHLLYVASATGESERRLRAEQYRQCWNADAVPVAPSASIDGTFGLRPDAVADGLRVFDIVESPADVECRDPVRAEACRDLRFAKIPRGLRFNDRVSMAHSRELRVPFLDHRLVAFAFGLPLPALISEHGGKSLVRRLLAKRVAHPIAFAPKRSVQSPQREWLAGEWRPLVESILTSRRFAGRGWIDPERAAAAYREYCDSARENSFFVWQWLNLELWARRYLDGDGSLADSLCES